MRRNIAAHSLAIEVEISHKLSIKKRIDVFQNQVRYIYLSKRKFQIKHSSKYICYINYLQR